MTRPRIAILCNLEGYSGSNASDRDDNVWAYKHSVGGHYVDAIWENGGLPVPVPCLGDPDALVPLLESCDGLLMTGGADVDPAEYGAEPSPHLGKVDPFRDAADRIATQYALREQSVPVLGICRGIQAFNVFCGGTLIQDIPTEVGGAIEHKQRVSASQPSHPVEVDPDSRLAEIWGAGTVMVNSFHHQAVQQPGEGLRIVARAPDGVVEAVEGEGDAWRVLVQCHPEHMFRDHDYMRRLFQAFIEAAKR
ncbi:MAG: gamma-glutamyl-gamma-aminobutyrate hydrolase family protein [Armatimonadetes bacterium]|nr:gamma-glutamyl-gamma-aminobutyrate hydrolase family protein [Armatimonadota bacterium]